MYATSIEIIQFNSEEKKSAYLCDFWNFMAYTTILLNLACMAGSWLTIDIEVLRTYAAITIFMSWVIAFYWARIFDQTSAFIRMLFEIFKDIKTFMIMLFICIMMFANSMLILNQTRVDQGTDEELVEKAFGFGLVDAFINQYMLGLGELHTEVYSGAQAPLIWAFFLLATFMT
mmetsp:Transcript_92798/g.127915  ORF Transcript_92798/g.127915 Transcript_92798/m.127915 type:complete len:174 (+) Transcript_92798:1157-1678(+)